MRAARWLLGIAAVAAVAILFLLAIREPGAPERAPAAAPEAATLPPASAPDASPPAAAPGDALRVAASEKIALDAASLEAGRPVALHLLLGEPSRSAEPLAVRVLGPNGRVLETVARAGDDRLAARLELDPAWLAPGVYLIELKTTEQSHFPERRYVLEVR